MDLSKEIRKSIIAGNKAQMKEAVARFKEAVKMLNELENSQAHEFANDPTNLTPVLVLNGTTEALYDFVRVINSFELN